MPGQQPVLVREGTPRLADAPGHREAAQRETGEDVGEQVPSCLVEPEPSLDYRVQRLTNHSLFVCTPAGMTLAMQQQMPVQLAIVNRLTVEGYIFV